MKKVLLAAMTLSAALVVGTAIVPEAPMEAAVSRSPLAHISTVVPETQTVPAGLVAPSPTLITIHATGDYLVTWTVEVAGPPNGMGVGVELVENAQQGLIAQKVDLGASGHAAISCDEIVMLKAGSTLKFAYLATDSGTVTFNVRDYQAGSQIQAVQLSA